MPSRSSDDRLWVYTPSQARPPVADSCVASALIAGAANARPSASAAPIVAMLRRHTAFLIGFPPVLACLGAVGAGERVTRINAPAPSGVPSTFPSATSAYRTAPAAAARPMKVNDLLNLEVQD